MIRLAVHQTPPWKTELPVVPRASVTWRSRRRDRLRRPAVLDHVGEDPVCDVAERARLCPVSVDLEREACEGALDEARDHHPVLAALPRADRVEEPDDDAVEAALLVPREREVLVHCLRVGVEPPLL